jgi:hypothetical protein
MRLCPEKLSLNPDDVTDVSSLQKLEGLVTDHVFPEVGLDPSLPVLQVNESSFPKIANRHDPAGDSEKVAHRFQLFVRQGIEGLVDLLGGVGGPKMVRKGVDPFPTQVFQFLDPLMDQCTRFVHFLYPNPNIL